MKVRSSSVSRQRGFTLAEILVATAVFTIILLAGLLIYDRSNRVFKSGVESAEMQQSTRVGFDKLVADLRMMGFDYDRDGVPQLAGEFQQPDEQVEYAGKNALTVRGNFDYYSDAANSHGREADYEPPGTPKKFPVVTTGNDEIVTYALKSADTSKNTKSFTFYADVARPRATYPGGSNETLVTISGIDDTNDNPPYTLYRFTLNPNGTQAEGVPVADNIRSLSFNYYSDLIGTQLVQRGSTVIAQGAIGGDGQYTAANPGATTNFGDRAERAKIQSVRVDFVGMNSSIDANYTNTAETSTVAALKKFRQYPLTTLVVPRNAQLSGTAEVDTKEPGPPTITSFCRGHCGAVILTWSASPTGTVFRYEVRSDTNPNGSFTTSVNASINLTSAVPNLVPGTTNYLKVLAVNDNGRTFSTNTVAVDPINFTKPQPPAGGSASNGEFNRITLNFTAPGQNAAGLSTLACVPSGTQSAATIPPYEGLAYRIWRGTFASFDPEAGEGTLVLDLSNPANQPSSVPGAPITWVDSAATANPAAGGPANCVTYYYRIQAVDSCSANAAHNLPADVATGQSTIYPASGTPALDGRGSSNAAPAIPASLTVDTANSSCNSTIGALGLCTIKLDWPKVTTDVGGASIAVDTYVIRRSRKRSIDPGYTSNPLADTTLDGATSMPGNTVTFTDNTAEDHDALGFKWRYEYTVSASQCGTAGNPSMAAYYPTPCTFASALVIQAGASTGDGITPSSAWLMNASDSVSVTAPVGVTLRRVDWNLYDSSGIPEPTVTQNAGPFTYGWTNRTDSAIYRMLITITDAAGCIQQEERFIRDEAPPTCSLTDGIGVLSYTPGNNFVDLTLTNGGTEDLTLRSIRIDWDKNVTPQPSQAEIRRIEYTPQGRPTVADTANSSADPQNRTVVSSATSLPSGETYRVRVFFGGWNLIFGNLQNNPITNFCVTYRQEDAGVDSSCRIFPGLDSTNNPTACGF